jgi:hypothetical protein
MKLYSEDETMAPLDRRKFTPGGFHSAEPRWAVLEAFDFHEPIGRERIRRRILAEVRAR